MQGIPDQNSQFQYKYNVGSLFEKVSHNVAETFSCTEKKIDIYLSLEIILQKTNTMVGILVDHVFTHFGISLVLHFDQEKILSLKYVRDFRDNKDQNDSFPQSDGMIKKFHRTFLRHLKIFVNKNQDDWDAYIPLILLTYRSESNLADYQANLKQFSIYYLDVPKR